MHKGASIGIPGRRGKGFHSLGELCGGDADIVDDGVAI